MAHKKAGGSSRNGRDSESKRLGVKVFGGQAIKAGGISPQRVAVPVLAAAAALSLATLSLLTMSAVARASDDDRPARSRHEIVSPEALRTSPPDLVVAMNPIYLDEIGAELAELGVETDLTAL